MDDSSSDNTLNSGPSHVTGVQTARLQIEAARVRQMELMAAGRLTQISDDGSPCPTNITFPGYTVIRELHRGGQGVVYQALQQSTNRKVAIKVLLEGKHASKSARQRFDREIELVASLRHPNVISVFHSDVTADGLRFCVMDYVCGLTITRYAREHQLILGETLKLFVQVCEAVNHAHQKGVIHRDLKPSNILVDVEGTPRVLDFGLAKLMGGPEETVVSLTGQVVGTLPYMSPEQTRGNPDEIDTRTDVYALGVLLYELLTGRHPYPVSGQMADVLRHIAETQPTPPSQAWTQESGVSQRNRPITTISGGSRLSRLGLRRSGVSPIDDEVQTIVLKALAKDRERRYQSAGELARDIEHYLANEPIEAKRDSALYVLGKQLRRHRVAVAVGVCFMVLLAGGLVTSLTFWYQTRRALVEKESEQQRAEAFGGFLTEVLTLADPAKAKGEKLTVREALDRAAKRIDDGSLKDQPLVEAEVRFTIASTYYGLGLFTQAEAHLRAADVIQSRELGNEHPDTLRTRSKLAETLERRMDRAAAIQIARPTMESQVRVLGPDHPDTLRSMLILGSTLAAEDHFAEAELLLQSAVEGRERVYGYDHPATAEAMDRLGVAYSRVSFPEKAERLHREALRINMQALGEENPATQTSMHRLARSLAKLYKSEEAEAIFRRVVELNLRVLGPEHRETIGNRANVASVVAGQGRHAEAESMYRDCLAAYLRVAGPDDRKTLTVKVWLASSLAAQRKFLEAESLIRDAVASAQTKYGPEHGDTTIRHMCSLASILAQQRKDQEAEQVARNVIEMQRRQLPGPRPELLEESSAALIEVLRRRGANEEALRVEQELIEFLMAATRGIDPSAQNLDRACRRLLFPSNSQLRDAPRALQLALEAGQRSGRQNPYLLCTLAQAYLLAGDSLRATQTWEEAAGLLVNDEKRAAIYSSALTDLLRATYESYCKPAEVLPFAVRANELTNHTNPVQLDKLALAYHLTGETAKAIELEKKALSLLAADAPDRADYENRLNEFERDFAAQIGQNEE